MLPTFWLALSPQGGEVPKIPIRIGEDGSTTLTALQMLPELLLSMPVQITFRGFLLINAPPDAASATTSFVAGVKSVCGTNIIGAIPWSIHGLIRRDKTGIVW